jgi:hypothetical protein
VRIFNASADSRSLHSLGQGYTPFLLCCAAIGTIHTSVDFLPVTRFGEEELESTISSMMNTLGQQAPRSVNITCVSFHLIQICRTIHVPNSLLTTPLNVPKLPRTASLEQFQKFWSQGLPLVITGLQSQMQGDWTPEYFIMRFGTQKVTLVDCKTESTQLSTVAEFFRNFHAAGEQKQILKLTVSLILH